MENIYYVPKKNFGIFSDLMSAIVSGISNNMMNESNAIFRL